MIKSKEKLERLRDDGLLLAKASQTTLDQINDSITVACDAVDRFELTLATETLPQRKEVIQKYINDYLGIISRNVKQKQEVVALMKETNEAISFLNRQLNALKDTEKFEKRPDLSCFAVKIKDIPHPWVENSTQKQELDTYLELMNIQKETIH